MSGSDEVSLKTPFEIQRFTNIENFIMVVFPELESHLKEQMKQGIQKSNLNGIAYSQLQNNFKLYIVRNYSKDIDDYLNRGRPYGKGGDERCSTFYYLGYFECNR